MSADHVTLQFGAVIEELEHLPVAVRDAIPEEVDSTDWICDRLAQAMHDAGQKYIDEHPELFRTPYLS